MIGLEKFVSSRIVLPDHIPGNRSAPKRLFEAWRRAFDAKDYAAMRDAKRVIDAAAAGGAPREQDMRSVEKLIE